jgi:hypothetical protein
MELLSVEISKNTCLVHYRIATILRGQRRLSAVNPGMKKIYLPSGYNYTRPIRSSA